MMFRGMLAILPLAFSAAAYGLAFGVFSAEVGFSALEIAMMGVLVFAGTSQIAAVEAFSASQAIVGSMLAAAVLNLRYIGIMATMPKFLRDAALPIRLLSIHFTADENWAQSLKADAEGQRIDAWYHLGAGIVLVVFWIIACVVGNLAGAALPQWTSGAVGFAFTAAFLGMLVGMMNLPQIPGIAAKFRVIVPVLVTFGSTLIASHLPIFGGYELFVGCAVGLAVALLPMFSDTAKGANP